MARKGLIPDPREERVRGLDPEKEDDKALKRWRTLDDDEKIREAVELRNKLKTDIERSGRKFDFSVDELDKKLRDFKRVSKKGKKAKANYEAKRLALVAYLQKIADLPVPEDSDSPVVQKILALRKFLAEYNREPTFDEAWDGMTDRQRIETAYRWCNNMTANDYDAARKMGLTPEYVEEFRAAIMKFDEIITAEERVAHIVDTNTPATKADADFLLRQMDAAHKKSLFITGEDILGRGGKKGN